MKLSFEQLAQGIVAVEKNVWELIDDAEALYKCGRYARAYTLANLAVEEISKIPMLFSIAFEIKHGVVDWKKFWKGFRDHKTKSSRQFAFQAFDEFFEEDKKMDLRKLVSALEDDPIAFESKKMKSLYVEFTDSRFVIPSEIIAEQDAAKVISLAKKRYSSIVESGTRSSESLLTISRMTLEQIEKLPKKVALEEH